MSFTFCIFPIVLDLEKNFFEISLVNMMHLNLAGKKLHTEPRGSLPSAWSPDGIHFIAHGTWCLSPLPFPLSPLAHPASGECHVFFTMESGLISELHDRYRVPRVACPL